MTRTRVGRARRGPGILSAAVLFITVVVAIGCGQPTPSAAPSGGSPVESGPDGSPGGSPGTAAGESPQPTAWPGNAVLGINALGVADGQIRQAIDDFNKGIATQDLALMRRAADGLAGVDVLTKNLDMINIFEPMKPFAEQYGAAVKAISSAAARVRDAIDARDAAAITTSSEELIRSLSLYTDVQPELSAWVVQSETQQRLLTK
jgi:hypothetical protein